ncbi:MAG: M1 family metallopeptidase [Saprospiraceae bacterium]
MKIYAYLIIFIVFIQCKNNTNPIVQTAQKRPDPHSFSMPQLARTTHLDLDFICDFDQKIIHGIATYDIENFGAQEIILDAMHLNIQEVLTIDKDNQETKSNFTLGNEDAIIGQAIHIPIQANTIKIKIKYQTTNQATALQWLNKEQTNSKKFPYLLTQSQSIYARSWIPSQDGPGIRFTYHANVKVPKGMMAAMSATNPQQRTADGLYSFDMDIPIPAYLMALAVGDFDFKPIGKRTGVYADSSLLDKAVWEFTDLEKMLESAETLYGEYPWKRYDVIVLPSSFPFGGMENPKLTFLTPTVIAGDRSLTSLLAHELAHSWSGNLVTNATWEDFWLNEGFTTYFENRIMESLYGKSYADMLNLLGVQDLHKTLNELGDTNMLTKLKLDLKDISPEDALTDIAYEKGKLLLRYLEERMGRKDWDEFLKAYFTKFKFKSNTTEGFLSFLDSYFPKMPTGVRDTVQTWVYKTGLLEYSPSYDNSRFSKVEDQLNSFILKPNTMQLMTKEWSTHEWLHFIRHLPSDSSHVLINILDSKFHLNQSGNSEIAAVWLNYLINNGIRDNQMPYVEHFLLAVGRRKYVLPLFEDLTKQGRTKEAKAIFEKAKAGYHPITVLSVEDLLYPKI